MEKVPRVCWISAWMSGFVLAGAQLRKTDGELGVGHKRCRFQVGLYQPHVYILFSAPRS